MIHQKFFFNEEVKLEALYTNLESSHELLFIHGMGGGAETWLPDLEKYQNIKAVALSLRGRGQSDSPKTGYSYSHHVSDVLTCIDEFKLRNPVIITNSVGAVWGLGVALQSTVKALVLIDHAAIQSTLTSEWVERVQKDPNHLFSKNALRGLINEFNSVNLFPKLPEIKVPIKLLYGGLEGSHITNEDIEDYQTFSKDIEFIELPQSGHGVSEEDEEVFWDVIDELLFDLD